MGKAVDLTGKRFAMLVALERSENDDAGNAMWLCSCDCGNEKIVRAKFLLSGHTRSCDCLRNQKAAVRMKAIATTHGHSQHPLNHVFRSMHQRCENPNDKSFPNYGGRGISVCAEWSSFEPFFSWALLNGYVSGLQIDRINNDHGYSPDNCRFVPQRANCENTRKCRPISAIDDAGNRITFPTITEAADFVGRETSGFRKKLIRGPVKLGGYTFRFDEKDN